MVDPWSLSDAQLFSDRYRDRWEPALRSLIVTRFDAQAHDVGWSGLRAGAAVPADVPIAMPLASMIENAAVRRVFRTCFTGGPSTS